MEAEKEESEDEEMEDDGADVSRRASTRVVWILMVVNSLSENPPQFTGFLFLNIQPPTSTKEPLRWQTLGKRYGKHWMFWSWFVHFQLGRWLQVYCHRSVGKARNTRISRPFVRICDPNLMGALFWDFGGGIFLLGKLATKIPVLQDGLKRWRWWGVMWGECGERWVRIHYHDCMYGLEMPVQPQRDDQPIW